MAPRPPFQGSQNFSTTLPLGDELAFRKWVTDNKVPFNADQTGPTDYDMRGFWKGLTQQNPLAQTAINPNDQALHFPDYWKTPLHQSFSAESQWAGPGAPSWINDSQLAAPSGKVVFDESQPRSLAELLGLLK